MLPSSDFLHPFEFLSRILVLMVAITGLWFAIRGTNFDPHKRIRVWLVGAGALVTWFGLAFTLGKLGLFQASDEVIVPAMPFAIILPVAVVLISAMRSTTAAKVLDATPLAWLIGLQWYRVLGAGFVVLWAKGLLPGEFALPAGIGDILVGILAVIVGRFAMTNHSAVRLAAYGWNALGILDLIVAVTTGFLTSPGPFHHLALSSPNLLLTSYQLVMIPAFAVPLSLILHGLCIWKLQRQLPMSAT